MGAVISFNNAGSSTTVLSSELSSLGSGSDSSAGNAVDNTPSGASLGYTHAIAEFAGTFAANANAGSAVYLYAILSLDGTNFGDAKSKVEILVGVFQLDAATTQRVPIFIQMFPCKQKYLAKTDAGQTLTSGAIKILPGNFQSN